MGLVVCLIGVLLIFTGGLHLRRPSQSMLIVTPASLFFGTLSANETKTKPVEIHNPTNESASIHSVITTCRCNTVPLTQEVLHPGETMKLDVSVSSSAIPGRYGGTAFVQYSFDNEPSFIKGVQVDSFFQCDE